MSRKVITSILVLILTAFSAIPVFAEKAIIVSIPVKVNIGNTVEISGESNLPETTSKFIEGSDEFKMSYSVPGSYKYKIQQKSDNPNIIVDEEVYDVEVFVFEENGKLNYYVSAIVEGNKTKEFNVEFNNKVKVNSRKVKFLKVSKEDNSVLEGAEFSISDDNNEINKTWTSGKEEYISEFPYGSYTLREIKAPEGYKKISDVKIEIHEDSINSENSEFIEIENDTVIIKDPKEEENEDTIEDTEDPIQDPDDDPIDDPENPVKPKPKNPVEKIINSVRTGDPTSIGIFLVIIAASVTGIVVLIKKRNKGKKEEKE